MPLNMMKVAAGAKTLGDLTAWQKTVAARDRGRVSTVTRMWPKREAELLEGGSLYWVIAKRFSVRQRVLGFERIDVGGVPKCRILLHADQVPVRAQAKKPFQGWRYLESGKAPPDLSMAAPENEAELERTLAELGLL